MRTGKMGIVVLIIALASTLLISWVISMDVEEQEVTKYNPLADITGEFSTERTPDYIKYNPSTNYTNYYTDDSIIGGTAYFDGVDYASSIANNYRLKLAPTESVSRVLDISSITEQDIPNMTIQLSFAIYADGEDLTGYVAECKGTTLTTILTESSISGYGMVRLSTEKSLSDVDLTGSTSSNPVQSGWVFIFPAAWASSQSGFGALLVADHPTYNVMRTMPEYRDSVNLACMSCIVDNSTRTATLYYDNDFQDVVGIYALDEMYVAYSYQNHGSTTNEFRLGDSLDSDLLNFPDPQYMDPSAGVELL